MWAAVPAAGSGSRMGSSAPKQYLEIAGKRLAEHTLDALLAAGCIHEIVVAIAPDDALWLTLPEALRGRVRTVRRRRRPRRLGAECAGRFLAPPRGR